MYEDLEFLKCYYRPSFFRMKIDLPIDLSNLNEIQDGAFALYLHEYIHFVQDISTIYGLMNISTINYYIQYSANKIHNSKSKKFSVPIELKGKNNDFGLFNFELRPIYMGTSINVKNKKIENLSYTIENKEIKSNITDNIEIIEISFTDSKTKKDRTIHFGGNHITEGMAYLSEQYVFNETLSRQGHNLIADEYPYSIVTKITELIFPEISDDKLLLISLCDASLMTYHPGLSFIRLLKHLKKEKVVENSKDFNDIYKASLEYLKGNHIDYEVLLETVRGEIKKSFNFKEIEGNNIWIDNVFDKIKKMRTELPEFVIDILKFGEPKNNQFFLLFHKLVGSPLVINGDSDGTISLPDGFKPENFQPGLFWAVNQLLRIFSNNKPIPCELKEYCKKSSLTDNNLIIDEKCDNTPWEKATEENLCPVGLMWKHWALTGFVPES
ncbi:hypothetical protein [Tenacibaculum ovolyticum]|uniref:hypothetical protein n=1 Tax=Tenacibaculum ovolyticum TaxID=104270 RepID=UPI003BA9B357